MERSYQTPQTGCRRPRRPVCFVKTDAFSLSQSAKALLMFCNRSGQVVALWCSTCPVRSYLRVQIARGMRHQRPITQLFNCTDRLARLNTSVCVQPFGATPLRWMTRFNFQSRGRQRYGTGMRDGMLRVRFGKGALSFQIFIPP